MKRSLWARPARLARIRRSRIGPVRQPRPGCLPAAVPEQLLHQAVGRDRHRAQGPLRAHGHAAQRRRKPIQPGQWNRNDGFSPGSLITTYVPGLDLAKTHGVPINDLARSYDTDVAIVVIDAKTLERNLIWTEMDANASSDSVRNLIVAAGAQLPRGPHLHRRAAQPEGPRRSTIPAGDAFRGYRDATTNDARAAHMDWIFKRLKKAGIKRDSLFPGMGLHRRQRAQTCPSACSTSATTRFAQLGDTNLKDLKIDGAAPSFKVTKVEPSDGLARKVTGYFERSPATSRRRPASRVGGFIYKPGTNEPLQAARQHLHGEVRLQHPRGCAADAGDRFAVRPRPVRVDPARWVRASSRRSGSEHDFVFCGTTWAGMGCELDTPPQDPAQFPDRSAGRRHGLAGQLRHPERGHGDQRPVALPHDDRPACRRACSPSSTWAA